jgi:AcrR family transcriptional regulator
VPHTAPIGKGAATQERIFVAAVARFAADGFRQTSVAQVARDAGVTAPAVHAHFGSKQALFHAAFEHDIAGLLDVVTARLAAGPLPGGGFALIPALLAELDGHPLARRIFQGREAEHTRELLNLPAVVHTRERLTALVAGAQHAGMLRSDLQPEALAGAMETIVLALLLGAVQIGMIGDDNRRLAILAILTTGVRGK